MAKVVLKNVKKVYREKRKSKKEYEQEQNLQITKDGVVAVQDFNLEIEDKEFIVLVGPSGCGKSTTLRMIAGLEEITSGELYIGDQLMNDVEPKDRNIAMVFQNYALYPHMSASENISFTLKLHKFDKPTILEKIKGAAKTLDINGLLDRRPKELSGGQRQRIAIGRAIVREPQVLLMDEPLSNLDAKLRNQMRTEIINLRNTIKSTFVYVTHDQIEAMTLGDRIVVMKDGFIQQIGTPQYVYNNPGNLFVAGFIGTPQMNFFDAKLLIKDKEYYVDIDGYVIKLPDDKQTILIKKETPEQDIILGVRPNYIYNDKNGIEGVVTILEMMGAETHVHIDVNGKSVIEILSTKDGVKLNKGDSVKINFDKEDIHIFSKETQNNLAI